MRAGRSPCRDNAGRKAGTADHDCQRFKRNTPCPADAGQGVLFVNRPTVLVRLQPVILDGKGRERGDGTLLGLLFGFGRSFRSRSSRSSRSFRSRSSRSFGGRGFRSRSGRSFSSRSGMGFSRNGRVHRSGRGRRGRSRSRGRSFAATNQCASERRRHNQRPNLLHQRSPQGAGSGRADRTTGAILRFGDAFKDGLTT